MGSVGLRVSLLYLCMYVYMVIAPFHWLGFSLFLFPVPHSGHLQIQDHSNGNIFPPAQVENIPMNLMYFEKSFIQLI